MLRSGGRSCSRLGVRKGSWLRAAGEVPGATVFESRVHPGPEYLSPRENPRKGWVGSRRTGILEPCDQSSARVWQSAFLLSFFFCLLGPHLRHMEVPRLEVKLELQLLAYTTATAVWGPSHVCDLHYSSQQRWIFNPLSKAEN